MFGGSFKEAVKRDPLVRLFRKITAPPEPAEWNYKQGKKRLDYHSRSFDYSLGIAHFKQAIKLVPDSALFHCSLGEGLLAAPTMALLRGARADFQLCRAAELAQPELQKAIRLEPSFPWPYYLLAVCYEYLGQVDKAKQICQQALSQKFPDNVREMFDTYQKALSKPSAQAQDPARATQIEEECLAHLKQVVAYRNARKFKEAEKELEAASKASPGGAWMYSTMCRLASGQS